MYGGRERYHLFMSVYVDVCVMETFFWLNYHRLAGWLGYKHYIIWQHHNDIIIIASSTVISQRHASSSLPLIWTSLFVALDHLPSSGLAPRTDVDWSEWPCLWARAVPSVPRSRRSSDWSTGSSQCAEAATERCHSSPGMWNRNRTWVVVGGLTSVLLGLQAII